MANSPFSKSLLNLANSPATKELLQFANSPAGKALSQFANSPAGKALLQFANSPAGKALSQFANSPAGEALLRIANSPGGRALQRLADSPATNALSQIANSPAGQALQSLANSPAMQYIKQIDAQHQKALNRLNLPQDIVGLAGLAGKFQNPLAYSDSFLEGFGDIQKTVSETGSIDNDDLNTVKDQFRQLIRELLDQLSQATEKIEIRSILRFLYVAIPFIFTIYSHLESAADNEETRKQSRREHSEILEELKALDEKIEELSKSSDIEHDVFYVVERTVPLNLEQRYHGANLGSLIPGQEVQLIERSGKWVKVVAFDFATKRTQQGWVLKKYLNRVD